MQVREYLIKLDIPLVHGGTNKINNDKLLILKQDANHSLGVRP